MRGSGLREVTPRSLKTLWWRWHEGTLKSDISWKVNAWRRRMLGERSGAVLPYRWNESPPRWQLIQEAIDRYGFKAYLEIGCAGNACFDKVRCETKVGVDPVSGGNVRKTSDEFFADNRATFDCIFIDGLHTYKQVRRDIENSLSASSENAVIFMHDCLPCTIGEQAMPREQLIWTGDVWKAIVELRTHPMVDTAVCTIDRGIGVVVKRRNTDLLAGWAHQGFEELTYRDYVANHAKWMRPVDYAATLRFIDGGAENPEAT